MLNLYNIACIHMDLGLTIGIEQLIERRVLLSGEECFPALNIP